MDKRNATPHFLLGLTCRLGVLRRNIKHSFMKKWIYAIALLYAAAVCSCAGYDDSALQNRVGNLESEVRHLKELCSQMNTNISAMQSIVNALQNNDYVTGVAPVVKNGVEIGYTIMFSKSSSITIYHGSDGKDGVDGKDGRDGTDGYTPIIGVQKDSDMNPES